MRSRVVVDSVTFRSRAGSWDKRLITFEDLRRTSLRVETRGVATKAAFVSVLLAFAILALCLFMGKTPDSTLLPPNFKEIPWSLPHKRKISSS